MTPPTSVLDISACLVSASAASVSMKLTCTTRKASEFQCAITKHEYTPLSAATYMSFCGQWSFIDRGPHEMHVTLRL